jgi:hypothetical protein
MTGTEIQCGSLRWRSTKDCAERAVIAMKNFQSDRALCVDPKGRVTVENPKSVCEYDLIAVYDVSRPLMELYREIKDELETEATKRGWRKNLEAA